MEFKTREEVAKRFEKSKESKFNNFIKDIINGLEVNGVYYLINNDYKDQSRVLKKLIELGYYITKTEYTGCYGDEYKYLDIYVNYKDCIKRCNKKINNHIKKGIWGNYKKVGTVNPIFLNPSDKPEDLMFGFLEVKYDK